MPAAAKTATPSVAGVAAEEVSALPVPLTHREILTVISGIVLGMFLAALDQTIVATALPRIAEDLHGVEHLSWIVAAYLLTATAATPIYGKLSDLYGRRALLRIAILIFVAASLLCGFAQTMPQLVIARALQGLGGGGLITMAQAAVADVVSPRERGRYQGYIASVWAVASVGGPIVGGFFADYLSWRWVFWINLPFGIAAFLLCHFALRKLVVRRVRRRIDYVGAIVLTAAITALLLVATWAGTSLPWTSPTILGLGLSGLALIVLFGFIELKVPEPILPPRLLLNPVIRTADFAAFIVAMALLGATVFLPLYFQLARGISASDSGLLLAPISIGSVIGGLTSGQLMRRTGRYKRYPVIGLAMALLGFLALALSHAQAPLGLDLLFTTLMGAGFGLTMPVMLVSVQNAAEPRDIGAATSSLAFFRSMGGSFGVAILWSVLLAVLGAGLAARGLSVDLGPVLLREGAGGGALPPAQQRALAAAMSDAFRIVFLLGSAITLAALCMMLRLKEIPLRTSSGAARTPAPARLGPSARQPAE